MIDIPSTTTELAAATGVNGMVGGQWIDVAEERRTLIEDARQSVMFAEYEEGASRAVIAPVTRDVPFTMEIVRAEA